MRAGAGLRQRHQPAVNPPGEVIDWPARPEGSARMRTTPLGSAGPSYIDIRKIFRLGVAVLVAADDAQRSAANTNDLRGKILRITGVVYVGDYGPDAGGSNADRGPGGQVEFNRIPGPGNYGWPYCTGSHGQAEHFTTSSGVPAGTTSLHLVFTGPTNGALFDVDSFTLTGGSRVAIANGF